MLGKIEYSQLLSENEFIEHEKGLYESFYIKEPNSWVSKNYMLIDNCRLKSDIPYSDQVIFAVKNDGKIISAIALNQNTNSPLQLEKMGFKIDESIRKMGFCEGLSFYIIQDMAADIFGILSDFLNTALSNDKRPDIKYIYGTCGKKLLNMYTYLFGFEMVDKMVMPETNSDLFLIRKPL